MNSSKTYALLTSLSTLAVLVINGLAQSTVFSSKTIGGISNEYQSMFTPASYAFSIWGLIFLFLILFSGYQLYLAFRTGDAHNIVQKTGPYLALANLFNCIWVLVFLQEWLGLSVLVMLCLLFFLIRLIIRLDMEIWDAPLQIIFFVWWPICIYAGWITVATIANISTWLVSVNWSGWGIAEGTWAILLTVVATLLNVYLLFNRNLREFALVEVWALVAIYNRHSGSADTLAFLSLVQAIVLFVLIGYHGFKNRTTSPLAKWKRGEWT